LIAEVTKNANAIGYVDLKAINNDNFKRIRIVGLLANDKIISFLDNEDWSLDSLIQSFNSLIRFGPVMKANNSIQKIETKLSKPKPSHLPTAQEPTRIKSKSIQSMSIPKKVPQKGKAYDPFKIIEPIEEL